MQTWYFSNIVRGDQTGSRYVYPTINLDPTVLPATTKRGVYASQVKVAGKLYQGATYFGPRLVKKETSDVLEIYLLDYTGEMTAASVMFTMDTFVRGVLDFPSLAALREQVTQDISNVRKALDET